MNELLTPNEWASAIVSVSKDPENSAKHDEALAFHG